MLSISRYLGAKCCEWHGSHGAVSASGRAVGAPKGRSVSSRGRREVRWPCRIAIRVRSVESLNRGVCTLAILVTDPMGGSARCCYALQNLQHASAHFTGVGTNRIPSRVGMVKTEEPSVASCSTLNDQSRLARAVESDSANSANDARSKP